MTTPQHWQTLIGLPAVDREGNKIGKVGQIYLDEATDQPEWVTLSTGLFGNRESFAPLYRYEVRNDQLVLAVPRQRVQEAPSIENDGHLGEPEIRALYEHYADYLNPPAQPGQGQPGQGQPGDDRDPGRAGDAMTRSEERLRVGTEKVPTGQARLRKYVVTEQVSTTVPVSHEEVRLEREPVTDTSRDAAMTGPDISEQEHEVTLHAERPVVAKETVPVERVRLTTETVAGEEEISEQVRKEQIDGPELDTDSGTAGH